MSRINSQIKFINLHSHDTFSVFDGFGHTEDHIDFSYSNGMDAMAITNHGNMNSFPYQLLHSQKLKEKGIDFKPIFGVEAYFHPSIEQWKKDKEKIKLDKEQKVEQIDDEVELTVEDEKSSKKAIKSVLNKRRHMILLAQNQIGLNNIFKLVSLSYQGDNYYRFPRIDYEMLKKYSEGVIASSACLGGIYAGDYWENFEKGKEAILDAMRDTTRKMQAIFGDRWYGELQWNSSPEQHVLNSLIIQISKEFDLRLVSTADSHYPSPEQWKDRVLYQKIGWLNKSDDNTMPQSTDEIGYEAYPKNGDQMFEAYKKYSELNKVTYDEDIVLKSIEETHNIAFNRIDNFTPDNTVKLPTFVIPEGMTADEALSKMAKESLSKTTMKDKEVYEQQLDRELEVIKNNKFSQYFLTMKAIIDRATNEMLIGPGRGSAAGSVLSYVLGITSIDPIRWGLQFERFMRQNQKDFPDIDSDFSSPMALKEILIKEWGADKVVPISNWNTLQLKSLIKDIAKFYDIPFMEVNVVTSKMLQEATPIAKAKHGIKAGVYVPTFEEVMEYSDSLRKFLDKYPQIEKHVNGLHGMIRSNSRHAGGVIVSENIDSCMPLINSGGVTQSPWSEGQHVRHLEPLGFIKFDILGLETLQMIETAIFHILRRHHGIKSPTFNDIKAYYDKVLNPDVIDFDDQKVYETVFQQGKWAGIFQFTQSGAQNFCVKAKPKSIIDLSAITSIYRPGPMCLSENTKILIRKNNWDGIRKIEYRYKTIKQVYENFHRDCDKNGKPLGSRSFSLVSIDENTKQIVSKNKIKNVFKSDSKEVFKLKVQVGLTGPKKYQDLNDIEASDEHKFLTNNGWKTLNEIKIGEYILILNKKAWKNRPRKTEKYVAGKKNFRNIAFYHYQHKCIFCDWNKGSLDVNHIDGDRFENNKPSNLCFICPNHHREWTEGSISFELLKEAQEKHKLFHSNDFRYVQVISKESLGFKETYDIEMEAPHHNFIAGDCVVHNSAGVVESYIAAQEKPQNVKYVHPLAKEITADTYGFLIFQEQIASLAHKLGKDISLEEGNQLRKVLTKKGTGKEDKVKTALYGKFIEGCLEKKISKQMAEEQWKTFEFFSGYGFNKSHAVSYSVISFQCAWLLTYYAPEWMAAFLDKSNEKEKETAINIAKNFGFTIQNLDINSSSNVWEIGPDNKTLIQPLTSIKGLGEAAYNEIIEHRPFHTIESFLFDDKIKYGKLNKKALDVLCRSGALSCLMDKRFSGKKHFWSAVAVDRVKTLKKFEENVEKYKPEGDFTHDEDLDNIASLTGCFPLNRVVSPDMMSKMTGNGIKPISEYDPNLMFVWFIPRKIEIKKTKNGKSYAVLTVIDSNSESTKIKCWSFNPAMDQIFCNKVYISRLDFDDNWGFSSRSVRKNFRLVA